MREPCKGWKLTAATSATDPAPEDAFEYDEDCPFCNGSGRVPGCFEDFCSGADCDPEDADFCCMPQPCHCKIAHKESHDP